MALEARYKRRIILEHKRKIRLPLHYVLIELMMLCQVSNCSQHARISLDLCTVLQLGVAHFCTSSQETHPSLQLIQGQQLYKLWLLQGQQLYKLWLIQGQQLYNCS